MSINLTDEIKVKTKKGKLGAAKQIFLEGDMQTVEKEIQDINSRHNSLNTKHESLSRTVQGIVVTSGASTATNVTYNNDNSGLNAENAQDAIDEINNIIIYDVSARNNGAVFESLQALLSNSNLNTLIPTSVRHGGMTIRYVQTSDNKYVQYRLMSDTFSTAETDWQGIDDVPIAGSNNLIKSNGVANTFSNLDKYNSFALNPEDIATGDSYDWGFFVESNYSAIKFKPIFSGGDKPYTISVYLADGIIGVDNTTYTFIKDINAGIGEFVLLTDVTPYNVFMIKYDNTKNYPQYTTTLPNKNVIIPNLIYRNHNNNTFTKYNGYLVGYFDFPDSFTEEEIIEVKDGLINLSFNVKIEGNDDTSSKYDWGFFFEKSYKYMLVRPQFQTDRGYIIEEYTADGEIGNTNTSYTLNKAVSYKQGDYAILTNITPQKVYMVKYTDDSHKLLYYMGTDNPYIKPRLCYRSITATNISVSSNGLFAGNFVISSFEILNKFIGGEQSPLALKNVYLIGDSITEHNVRANINWTMYLKKFCKCNVTNKGLSGSGFSTSTRQKYKSRIPSADTQVDIFGVAISFNDLDETIISGISIGSPTDDAETTICGYINVFFDTLFDRFPSTPVICYIQNPWAAGGTSPVHPAYRYGGTESDAFVNAVKQTLSLRGVPFYDDLYYNGSVLMPWIAGNRAVYFTSDVNNEEDTDHPNSQGHKVIYKYLKDKFEMNVLF